MGKRKKTGGSALRAIDGLLREVIVIEEACVPLNERSANAAANNKDNSGLDAYQVSKRDLTEALHLAKQDVKTIADLAQRLGERNTEVIRLKNGLNKELTRADNLLNALSDALEKNKKNTGKRNRWAVSNDELKRRTEIFELLEKDMKYTRYIFNQATGVGGSAPGMGNTFARRMRDERRRRRQDQATTGEVAAPPPITAAEKQFLQESVAKDHALDVKLDIIHQGVKRLGAIGQDVQDELDTQEKMLTKFEVKLDDSHANLQNKNERMRELLEATGGWSRWCPIITAVILLLAIGGYVFSMMQEDDDDKGNRRMLMDDTTWDEWWGI